MHSELRRARGLHHDWHVLPEHDRAWIAPLARDVKDLALDLRGHLDSERALEALTKANDALAEMLRRTAMPRAA